MLNRSMITAAVTMGQIQHKLDVIGHNLANSSTAGYKARSADFASLLIQQVDNLSDDTVEEGRLTPDGIRLGTGARIGHTNIDFSPGAINVTGRALDVALTEENHLFQLRVQTPGGVETHYTRSGNFYLSPLGTGEVMLTNSEGLPVLGEGGTPIVLQDGMEDVRIGDNGSLLVTRGGEQAVEAQLDVIEAVRPRMLEAIGGNRFRIPDEVEAGGIMAEVAPQDQIMKSGALETSNVNMGTQITEMLMAQRAYQFNARTISTTDQMMGLVNQLRS